MKNPWKLTSILFATLLAGTTAVQLAAADAQPKMEDALTDLRAAANKLEKANHDKGGHRAKALDLTREAIKETEAGIKFDNKH